jgi:serine/threonine-protein kinase
MSTDAVRTFVAQLRQAQLLEPAQQQEAERLGQTAARPAELAGALVKRGWITPYQANQVARGRGAELVLGSYTVLEPLARGGMGQVFKARHRYLHRLVALKFIRPEQRDSQDTVQRFQREVRLLADLRHPHIVQAHDAGNVGEVWFLAMELLEGVNLDQLVQKAGPLPVGQACAFLRQAALGLQHAHERGLVHRDIKPSNLFLTGEGIKLLDLGLARPQSLGEQTQPGDLTRANSVMGTPDYLAPEQALDPRRAGTRSDLYSLGCTQFFLLTGRPPFPEGTLAQKLLYHQQTPPPPVERFRPDVPPAVAELLRRLLAKAPEQRPVSAAEVAACLAPFADPAAAAAPVASSTGVHAVPPTQSGPAGVAASPSSLIDSKATAPQRGFTLMADSLAPTPPPSSLVIPAGGTGERGWTLAVESLPPAVRASAAPAAVAPAPAAAPPASRRRLLVRVGVLAGAALGGALLLLLAAVSLGWFASPAPSPAGPQAAQKTEAVLKTKEPATSLVFPKGPRRFLSELQEFDVLSGEWPFRKADTGEGKPIQVGGVPSPHGLGMHPPAAPKYASVKYRLGKEAELFKATVAIDDSTKWCWSPATFTVLGDGKELWKSTTISHHPPHVRSQECQVIVKGVDVLELRVQVPNLNKGVHAVWFEPRVLRKFDSPDGPGAEEKTAAPAGKGPDPGAVAQAKVPFNVTSALTANDAEDARRRGSRCKIWHLGLTAGKKYVIAMNQAPGSPLDPYLRVEDATAQVLAEDDDGGGGLNARVVFTPPQTGVYRVVATTFVPGQTGGFLLTASEAP